ncbi:hypothetical protein P2318_11190 [Myxococcaceae bacterium GXIMD 01537]
MRKLLTPGPAALIALVTGVWLGISPLKNYDLFFHLAGGRWLLEHGFTPVDPFSITGTAGWFPHEWGFGVLCMLLVRGLGAAGPALLVATLVVANLLLLWRAMGRADPRKGLLALLVLGAVLAVQGQTWSEERPYHLGHLLFTLAVLAVQSWRAGNDRILWLFPVLGVAWVNLHGSWLLGPALLGASAVGLAVDDPSQRRRAGFALLAAAAAFLGAGLSPSGTSVYLYPLHHSLLESTQNIVEWTPINLKDSWSWPFLALLGGALFWAGASPQRRIAILLPTAGLAVAALKVQRHATFAAVLLGLALLEHAAQAQPLGVPGPVRRLLSALDGALTRWSASASGAPWPGIVLALLALIHAQQPVPIEEGVRRSRIPIAAMERLKALPPGRVMNDFIAGGVISYFAGPEYKVFIDPRNDPFPDAIHRDYMRLQWGEPGWEEALTRYDPDYLVWLTGSPSNILLEHLRRQGGWREELEDSSGFVLWVRERP